MSFVVLAFYEVWPPVSGSATVTWSLARHLSGPTALFQLSPSVPTPAPKAAVRIENIDLRHRSGPAKVTDVLARLPGISRRVAALRPETVILEGASWSVLLLAASSAIRRAAPGSKIVYHAHNVEYLLRKSKNPRLAGITRWAEGRLLRTVHQATAVSLADADAFQRLYGVRPCLLPNGIDVERFAALPTEREETLRRRYALPENAILFMGLPAYPPNAEGLVFLRDRILPRLEGRDAQLVVIGGKLEPAWPGILNPGIIPFEDIPAFIRACRVCVAPIFSGSGTRLKILESMAAGRPVVATTKAAEGLPVVDGRDLLLRDDADGFAGAIRSLMADSALRGRLGRAGCELVARTFAWDAIVRTFESRLAGEGELHERGVPCRTGADFNGGN